MQQHSEVDCTSLYPNMMGCSLVHQLNTWLYVDGQTQQHSEEEFNFIVKWRGVLPDPSGVFGSQFWLEMKNLIIFKYPFPAARCKGVCFLAFLLVGSQCISIVRNFTTSMWPYCAALWRGVSWTESLHIGSQSFSTCSKEFHNVHVSLHGSTVKWSVLVFIQIWWVAALFVN